MVKLCRMIEKEGKQKMLENKGKSNMQASVLEIELYFVPFTKK